MAMRFWQHIAVFSAFAIIAAVIVLARPHHDAATPVSPLAGAQVAAFRK
jgi:hypothetical protein